VGGGGASPGRSGEGGGGGAGAGAGVGGPPPPPPPPPRHPPHWTGLHAPGTPPKASLSASRTPRGTPPSHPPPSMGGPPASIVRGSTRGDFQGSPPAPPRAGGGRGCGAPRCAAGYLSIDTMGAKIEIKLKCITLTHDVETTAASTFSFRVFHKRLSEIPQVPLVGLVRETAQADFAVLGDEPNFARFRDVAVHGIRPRGRHPCRTGAASGLPSTMFHRGVGKGGVAVVKASVGHPLEAPRAPLCTPLRSVFRSSCDHSSLPLLEEEDGMATPLQGKARGVDAVPRPGAGRCAPALDFAAAAARRPGRERPPPSGAAQGVCARRWRKAQTRWSSLRARPDAPRASEPRSAGGGALLS